MEEFIQAAEYYRHMTDKEKEGLIENLTESLLFESETAAERVLKYLGRVDETLEKILRKRLRF